MRDIRVSGISPGYGDKRVIELVVVGRNITIDVGEVEISEEDHKKIMDCLRAHDMASSWLRTPDNELD